MGFIKKLFNRHTLRGAGVIVLGGLIAAVALTAFSIFAAEEEVSYVTASYKITLPQDAQILENLADSLKRGSGMDTTTETDPLTDIAPAAGAPMDVPLDVPLSPEQVE